jgi:hypothetical protein
MLAMVMPCVLGELGMAAVMLGVDPHKGSYTAVLIGAGPGETAETFCKHY